MTFKPSGAWTGSTVVRYSRWRRLGGSGKDVQAWGLVLLGESVLQTTDEESNLPAEQFPVSSLLSRREH